MMTLAIVLAPAGAMLLLVALIGGGFTFSGWAMPKIGKIARIPCFVIGGVLVLLAISLAVGESSLNSGQGSGQDATLPMTASEPVLVPVPESEYGSESIAFVGEAFFSVDAHEAPYLDAAVTSRIYEGDLVAIYCTVQGEAVTDEKTGYTSSLWNGIDSGFVPDVAVDTGTDQATMSPC
jgi:hypothetical protein